MSFNGVKSKEGHQDGHRPSYPRIGTPVTGQLRLILSHSIR